MFCKLQHGILEGIYLIQIK